MKNKSFEITIIIGLIIFSGIIFGFYLIYNLYLDTKSYTLFLNPSGILECKKWDCKDKTKEFNNYNNKPYTTFINGENKGINDIYYNNKTNKYYVFNKSNDNIYTNGTLFGYTGKSKITQPVYQIDTLTDNEINELKGYLKISFENDLAMYTGKITIDFDNDGEKETIYQMSSGLDAPTSNIYFDYLIYKDNNKYYKLIEEKTPEKDMTKIGLTTISSVLDIFDDKKLELIVKTEYPITGGSCTVLYRLKGKKFNQVNDCEN